MSCLYNKFLDLCKLIGTYICSILNRMFRKRDLSFMVCHAGILSAYSKEFVWPEIHRHSSLGESMGVYSLFPLFISLFLDFLEATVVIASTSLMFIEKATMTHSTFVSVVDRIECIVSIVHKLHDLFQILFCLYTDSSFWSPVYLKLPFHLWGVDYIAKICLLSVVQVDFPKFMILANSGASEDELSWAFEELKALLLMTKGQSVRHYNKYNKFYLDSEKMKKRNRVIEP